MSIYVTTLLTFKVGSCEALMKIARSHVARVKDLDTCFTCMLESIADGHHIGHGTKGDVFSYAFVGNCTNPCDMMEILGPFFLDCLTDEKMTGDDDRIIVMYQSEQSHQIRIYEIGLPWTAPEEQRTISDLVVRGRRSNFPVWHGNFDDVKWFDSSPIYDDVTTGQWEGEGHD